MTTYMSTTGRKFIVDDNNGEFLPSAPDHDEWAVWTEWVDNIDGSLWYVSDHEGYTLDAEEFGPLPDFLTYGPHLRPLQDVLDEYMAGLQAKREGKVKAVKCGTLEPHDEHNWGIGNGLVCDGRGLAADDRQVEPGAGRSALTGEEYC